MKVRLGVAFIFLAIVALVSALVWCMAVEIHSHSLKSGVVIRKQHYDAWAQTTFIYIDKMMIPQTTYWPETWNVTMKGSNASGEQLTRNLSLTKSSFDKIAIGQQINTD